MEKKKVRWQAGKIARQDGRIFKRLYTESGCQELWNIWDLTLKYHNFMNVHRRHRLLVSRWMMIDYSQEKKLARIHTVNFVPFLQAPVSMGHHKGSDDTCTCSVLITGEGSWV